MYQWSTRVARDVVRYDWRLRNQNIRKTVHMIVTPNVVVRIYEPRCEKTGLQGF